MNITFKHAIPGHPVNISSAQTAMATIPAGCSFWFSADCQSWAPATSPFTAPANGWVRIDCDVHEGAPVEVALSIEGPAP